MIVTTARAMVMPVGGHLGGGAHDEDDGHEAHVPVHTREGVAPRRVQGDMMIQGRHHEAFVPVRTREGVEPRGAQGDTMIQGRHHRCGTARGCNKVGTI